MQFKNRNHGRLYEEIFGALNRKNRPLLAAVYLLTADPDLWERASNYVSSTDIEFRNISMNGASKTAFTLCAAAQDILTGSSRLPLRDLADSQLISPMIYRIICCAMEISRKGVKAVWLRSERYYLEAEDVSS